MASSTETDDYTREGEVRLWRGDSKWVAKDVETGVVSQGDTREKALEMLDDAVALHEGESGRPVTEDDLGELGIDPEQNVTAEEEPPDVLE